MATYCGRFDDFAAKHTQSAITTLAQLNESLLQEVLIGDDRLLVNDGHMAMNRAIRKAILSPAKSPLLTLVREGYVQILTRNQRQLASLVPLMADQGITSAKKLLADPRYAEELQPALVELTEELNRGGHPHSYLAWPTDNTTEIFRNLALNAYDNAIAACREKRVEEQFAAFRSQLDQSEHRRTDWEDIADSLRVAGKLSADVHRSLMYMANEAYQYSWGCALQQSVAIRVNTEAPRYLRVASSFEPPAGQMRKEVSLYVPNLDLAASKVGEKWERLAQVVVGPSAVKDAKETFRRTLRKYYTSNEVGESDMRKEARAYSDALAEHFSDTKKTELIFGGVVVNGASTVAGAVVGSAAGPIGTVLGAAAGFAVGVVGAAGSTYLRVPHLLMKLRKRPKTDWIYGDDEVPANGVSSFEIDPGQARESLRGVTRFSPP
jgi:hypothetical protein